MDSFSKNTDFYLERTTIISMYVFAAAMPFSIALTQIALSIALLSWLLRVWGTKTAQFKSLRLEGAFIAFIAVEILALVFSTNFSQNFIFLKRLLLIPIVYLFALNISEKKQFNRIVAVFIIAVTLYSFTGIISFFMDPSLRVRHIQNSMTAGGITMIGGLASFALAAFLADKKWRVVALIFALVNIICLLLTSTRGSWLGFFFGLLLLVYFANKKFFLAVPIILLTFYFLGPAAFSDRVKHMFDPTWRTNAKRIFWWSVGWEIFKDHPLVGIGDVSTDKMFKEYIASGKY